MTREVQLKVWFAAWSEAEIREVESGNPSPPSILRWRVFGVGVQTCIKPYAVGPTRMMGSMKDSSVSTCCPFLGRMRVSLSKSAMVVEVFDVVGVTGRMGGLMPSQGLRASCVMTVTLDFAVDTRERTAGSSSKVLN